MNEPTTEPRATGHCLCEGVSFEIHGELRDVIDCHCDRCRRTTGHHMAAAAADLDSVHLVSDETLRWYEAGGGAAYGFCERCGASVFWRTTARPTRVSIAAGLLDPPTALHTIEVIHASTASDYHELDPDVPSWPLEHE